MQTNATTHCEHDKSPKSVYRKASVLAGYLHSQQAPPGYLVTAAHRQSSLTSAWLLAQNASLVTLLNLTQYWRMLFVLLSNTYWHVCLVGAGTLDYSCSTGLWLGAVGVGGLSSDSILC